MNKITALLCLFLILPKPSAEGQVLFYEDFEAGFELNGWIAEPGWATGTSAELSSDFFEIPPYTRFAGINDDIAGENGSSVGAIISPQISLEGASSVLLTFDCYFIDGDYEDFDETAKVLISTDSMETWTELLDVGGATQWQSLSIPLGEGYIGQNIHLAFAYDDGGGWNYGFCVDNVQLAVPLEYQATVRSDLEQAYTLLTPNQSRPLIFVQDFENLGAQALEGIQLIFSVILDNELIHQDTQFLASIAPGAVLSDTIAYQPTDLGSYTFQFLASHPELGENFHSRILLNAFELDETDLAKDLQRGISIGFSFGNPSWYGYYGSEFDLVNPDTLVGISVFMTTNTAGSFNLLVNVKDEEGLPTIELFHSEPIPIGASFNNWVYFPLPEPMHLDAGNYVFAVGQDTVQGIMGHGFDNNRLNPGYWITSPVAGGGYPWTNFMDGLSHTLMIRPRFPVQTVVSTSSPLPEANDLLLYPNPFSDELTVHLRRDYAHPLNLQVFDLAGRQVFSTLIQGNTPTVLGLEGLPSGVYVARVFDGERLMEGKVVKR